MIRERTFLLRIHVERIKRNEIKMKMSSTFIGNRVIRFLLCLGILLVLYHDARDGSFFGHAKEIEVTDEWQKVEGNDTIPAGVHVRMDMTTGEKWVKNMSEEDEEEGDKAFKNVHINKDEKSKKSLSVAVVDGDGDVTIEENEDKPFEASEPDYDFEMMHRTLSKLPPEEIVAMGGLPDIPDSENRAEFEERMLEIWKKRQAELLDLEMNFPEILKARIAGIKEYLEKPEAGLNEVDLEEEGDEDVVTDIVSLLKDLEFQLSDIDMARDFHTMDGWPLLVKLLSVDTHVPANKTIDELTTTTHTKIRTVQSYAAWAIGTAVKNTEEFYPYGIESVFLDDGKRTTAIDQLVDIFCDNYSGSTSWEVRTLLTKSIYGIGAILRGNGDAQKHIAKRGGFARLGKKYRELAQQGFNSANTKLIQRMAGLSMDIVQDLLVPEMDSNDPLIDSISSAFCDATCELFSSEIFVPTTVQETLVRAISVMGPYCKNEESSCATTSIRSVVETIQSDWLKKKDGFDEDHYAELDEMAREALWALDR